MEFLFVSPCEDFLAFGGVFPFFSRDFLGFGRDKNSYFLVVFLPFFQKKSKERKPREGKRSKSEQIGAFPKTRSASGPLVARLQLAPKDTRGGGLSVGGCKPLVLMESGLTQRLTVNREIVHIGNRALVVAIFEALKCL